MSGSGDAPNQRRNNSYNGHHMNQIDSKIASNEAAIERRRQELEQINQAKMRASQSNAFPGGGGGMEAAGMS